MLYIIYFSYIALFLTTSYFLKSKIRFLTQCLLLLIIVRIDSYYFYFDFIQEASDFGRVWLSPGFRAIRKANLDRYSFSDHLFLHHYVYSFIVYMILLNVFHFGSKIVDHLIKTYPSRKYDK